MMPLPATLSAVNRLGTVAMAEVHRQLGLFLALAELIGQMRHPRLRAAAWELLRYKGTKTAMRFLESLGEEGA